MIDDATIAAIATPPGVGAIGMIRVSGSEAASIADRVFRMANPLPLDSDHSHRIHYGHIVEKDGVLDEAMLTWLAAPHTYTREDTIELTCHGGPVTMREVMRLILAAGARQAEPGEFTLRAYLNGRIDLTQAEAVLQVVSARTAESLELALGDLAGGFSQRIAPARQAVVSALAWLDAAADFPEDEIPATDLDADLGLAESTLTEAIAGGRAGMLFRDGVQIALVGRPNAGKSSLMNALLRSDRAIVTPVPGTTRDVVAETINVRGIPMTLLDTAGIAATEDLVERLGIERSERALASSAGVIFVLDGSSPLQPDDWQVAERVLSRIGSMAEQAPLVLVRSKSDLETKSDLKPLLDRFPDYPVIPVSSVTGSGIDQLESTLANLLTGDLATVQPALISSRQRAALERALEAVRNARRSRAAGYPVDLLATDVRSALHALGEVTGEDVDEAVLQEIFGRFCIGK